MPTNQSSPPNAVLEVGAVSGSYHLAARGEALGSLTGSKFKITYAAAALEIANLCALTWDRELAADKLEGTAITIISFAPGALVLAEDKAIPQGKLWTGVLNVVRFRALQTRNSSITVTSIG